MISSKPTIGKYVQHWSQLLPVFGTISQALKVRVLQEYADQGY
jgi:hypothetical protein